jgi:hypothetical protein
MNKLSAMQAVHKGLKAGFPAVNGWMIDTKTIKLEDSSINAVAYKEFNTNGRNFIVSVGGELVGTVYYRTGSQFVAFDLKKNEISTYTGDGAEFKCFVDLVLSARG